MNKKFYSTNSKGYIDKLETRNYLVDEFIKSMEENNIYFKESPDKIVTTLTKKEMAQIRKSLEKDLENINFNGPVKIGCNEFPTTLKNGGLEIDLFEIFGAKQKGCLLNLDAKYTYSLYFILKNYYGD